MGAYEADSMLQKIIDSLKGTSVKVIVSGSAVSMMKEMLDEGNPLFDRFGAVINLKEFDYYDASLFMKEISERDKTAYYSVFGGSPNVLEAIDTSLTLENNIERLLLAPDGRIRSFIEHSLLMEYGKIGSALSIFEMLGNSKKTYTEIKDRLDPANTVNLAKQLEKFINNESIRKVRPINKKNEKKRTFYTISDNLIRFYFRYVYPNRRQLELINEKAVFDESIKPSLDTYISNRFESIAHVYFVRLARNGKLPGIVDIGTYWYDDKEHHANGEFGCVLEFRDGYDVFEVKYYKDRMTESAADKECEQIRAIKDFKARRIGFVSISGFDFESDDYVLITGEDLFNPSLAD